MRLISTSILALVTVLAISGCAQPYKQKFLNSPGYSETQIDDYVYEVRFDGGANVGQDAAWNYWIYRCAQLTKEKGHTYFTMIDRNAVGKSAPSDASMRYAKWNSSMGGYFLKTRGGGGSHTTYVYMPGGYITTWHSKATIEMFDDTPPKGIFFAVDAQSILDQLGDYVASQGHVAAPDKQAIIARSNIRVNLSPLRGS